MTALLARLAEWEAACALKYPDTTGMDYMAAEAARRDAVSDWEHRNATRQPALLAALKVAVEALERQARISTSAEWLHSNPSAALSEVERLLDEAK